MIGSVPSCLRCSYSIDSSWMRPALVAGLHRAEHAAPVADAIELGEDGLFDERSELLHDERALQRVVVLGEAPLAVDDELDRHRAAHRLVGRRGDRLVVRVGVQRVGVVVDRAQRLQRRADVVERDLLRVQRPARRLDVVLEPLAAIVGAVAVAQRDRPDAARHSTEHRVLGIEPVGEEERQVRREVVDRHAAREVGLHVREAVGQRERELADRVRARLRDVVAGDRHAVEAADLVVDEPLLDVGHHPQREVGGEDAGVLPLILLEDVGLHRAPDAPEHLGGIELGVLVDRGVEEHGEDRGRGPVDRHRHRRRRIDEVEAVVEHLHVVERRDRHAGRADLAVDVGALVGVGAVQRDRVERGGQPRRGLPVGEQVEAAVGAGGPAFAGEHARRVLVVALRREHAGGVREAAGQVLAPEPAVQVVAVPEPGQRDAGHERAGDRLARPPAPLLGIGAVVGEQAAHVAVDRLFGSRDRRIEVRVGNGRCNLAQRVEPAQRNRALVGDAVIAAHRVGDLGEVAPAVRRHQRADLGGDAPGHGLEQPVARACAPAAAEQPAQVLVHRGDTVVVEPRRHAPEHREGFESTERLAVARHLPADVAERVVGAASLELVDHHQVGEVEHVDLLELRRRAVLGRHDVDRHVGQVGDRGVALADTGRLDHDEVEPGHPARVDHRGQVRREPLRWRRASRSSGRTPAASSPPPCECGHRATRRRPAVSRDRRQARRRGPCPAGRAGAATATRR